MADTLSNQVVVGSGKLYITDFTTGSAIPDDATIEVDTNKVGNISGGATLESKYDFKQVKDDFDVSVVEYYENEAVTFKSGVLTWTPTVLNRLIANGEVTTDATSGKTTLFIGGRNKDGIKRQLVRFVHTLKNSGKTLRITLVGTPTTDFKMDFEKDKETVVDAEFIAVSQDDNGTLVSVAIS